VLRCVINSGAVDSYLPKMNILDQQIYIYNKRIFWIHRFISIINEYFITEFIEIAKNIFVICMLYIQIGSGTTLSSNLFQPCRILFLLNRQIFNNLIF
jgi:hypothetical protein